MVKSVLLLVLSVLAVSSAQLANVPQPQRVRDDHTVVQSSSKNQDNAFGRSKSNLRSGGKKQRNLQAMSIEFSMPAEVEENAETAAIEEVEVLEVEQGSFCTGPDGCSGGTTCTCVLNCLLCLDDPRFQLDSLCGTCAV
mmetsp:Transcript_2378/g.5038  ORF Transcript_2378/g.5038 Transcript_2378/m.5038 type:complete len:139 (-) Transcript_2378:266-682(-)